MVGIRRFTFSCLTTPHVTNDDKNGLKCCYISMVVNINSLQYCGNLAIHIHYVTSHWAQKPKPMAEPHTKVGGQGPPKI